MPAFRIRDHEHLELLRRRPGAGGFGSLMRRLQATIDTRTMTVQVPDDDVERLVRYATEYGGGGWEDRLGPFVPQARAWLGEQPEQGSLL